MNSKLQLLVYPVIAALSLAAAVSAHAESPTADDSATQVWSQTKTKTRDQVRAELFKARADGTTRVWSISHNPLRDARSLKARDEVRAEVLAQRAADNGNPLVGEDSGSFYLAQQRPVREAARLFANAGGPAR